MPVVSTPRPAQPAHVNPPLVVGEVYRIVKGSGILKCTAVGALFTYCPAHGGTITCLRNTAFSGGYDYTHYLEDNGILYEVVDIAEV